MAIKSIGFPEKLGELIIKWANEPETRPVDVIEFMQQAGAAGAEIEVDGGELHLDLADQPESRADTIHVRIPHKNDINNALAMLPNGGAYPLHVGYDDAFSNPARRSNMTQLEIKDYNEMVIGQYTTKKCL